MSDLAGRIMDGLGEALDHATGKTVPELVAHEPPAIDVAGVRRRTGLTQEAFASRIGVSLGTLRNWEQRRRAPEGPARVLLTILDRHPRLVEDARPD